MGRYIQLQAISDILVNFTPPPSECKLPLVYFDFEAGQSIVLENNEMSLRVDRDKLSEGLEWERTFNFGHEVFLPLKGGKLICRSINTNGSEVTITYSPKKRRQRAKRKSKSTWGNNHYNKESNIKYNS